MNTLRAWLLWLLFASAAQAGVVYTDPGLNSDSRRVFCHGVECGTMFIDSYRGAVIDGALGGVEIDGHFAATRPGRYHYVQAVTTDDDPPLYIDGTKLPHPYIDTPPGGYRFGTLRNPWDGLLYYDEAGEFPRFYDFPKSLLATARGSATPVRVFFETWLVCVITELLGPELGFGKDDFYEIAPLIGWEWGYSISWADNGNGIDDLADYTVTRRGLTWLGGPTVFFQAALGMDYGNPRGMHFDRFNVVLGDCINCAIPEPPPAALVGLGLVSRS